jgi:hypothetical protein
MKKQIIFKILIDLLFFALCIGFLSTLFVMPFGLTMIAQESKEVYDWSIFSWAIFILSLIAYIFLIIGIKQLRSAAKNMLQTNSFDDNIPKFLKRSGNNLILSSLLNYLIFIITFFKQLGLENKLNITFDNNFLLQMIVTIVGLFFIIQSNILIRAAEFKHENDLTI